MTVPLESTRTKVKKSDLYGVDEVPIDTRDLAHRNRYASFPCPTCMTILAIESEAQLGTQIVCPECGVAVTVPSSLQESFTEKQRKAAEIQARSAEMVIDGAADVYGIAGSGEENFSAKAQPKGTFAVYCGLCNTMLYATPEMVGQNLICPECGRDVLVRKPEKPKQESFQATNFEGGTHYGAQSSPEIFELGKHFPNTRLVPVVCTLCKTRMYALETEIGQSKTCPDCGTQTEIADVPEEQRILPETTGSEYAVKEPPVAKRPTFRVGVDYRTVEGSLDLEHQRQLQKIRDQEEAKKKPAKSKGKDKEQPVELIEQKPFSPTAVPGAKPDAYDLQPAAARLLPKPPPLPQMLDSDQPVHVPAGPLPELVHGRKTDADGAGREVVLENVRTKNRRELSHDRVLTQAEIAEVIYSRPRPPRRPFTTRLLRPFFCNDFYQSFMAAIAVGTLPVAAFTYAGPEGFGLFAGGIAGVGGTSAFTFLILTTVGVVTGSYWVSFFVTYLLHLFAATSDGDDELGALPEYAYIDGLFSAGRMITISFLAALPGYLIWLLLHLFALDWQGATLTLDSIFNPVANPIPFIDSELGPCRISFLCITFCLLSHWIFHPILFLASCETTVDGGVFLSSNTIKNLFRNPSLWSAFYCYVFPVAAFLACYVYLYFINGIFWESLFWSGVFFVSFLLAGSAALVVYFRLLGRLAWVIETESRKRRRTEE